MAAIETNTKISLHIRSNGFPSSPHPFVSQFEEHLNRLRSSEASSSSSVSLKLNGLRDLYDCTDKLHQLPTGQQALAQECNEELVDKDFLLQSKESIQEHLKLLVSQ